MGARVVFGGGFALDVESAPGTTPHKRGKDVGWAQINAMAGTTPHKRGKAAGAGDEPLSGSTPQAASNLRQQYHAPLRQLTDL